MLFFGTFRHLMSSLGSSWRPWPILAPKLTPKWTPNLTKHLQKNTPKFAPVFGPVLERFLANFGHLFGARTSQSNCPGTSGRPTGPIKKLKNVKGSSKWGFSLQEMIKNMLKIDPKIALVFGPILDHLLNRIIGVIVPPSWPKLQSELPGTLRLAYGIQKQFKNVKLSSKSGCSPQELPNLSQGTNMKRSKNVK